MAKKSAAGRASARRPATAARSASVTLVRDPVAKTANGTGATAAASPIVDAKRVSAAAAVARPVAAGARPATKPVAARPAPAKPAPPARQKSARGPVANTMTNRRTLIRAENFGYVRRDLVFILVLAVVMFAVMVVLHFVLPS